MNGIQKFYQCKHCGNLTVLVVDMGVPVVCCGEKMPELIPNTVDAAVEKHIPAVTVSGDRIDVQVGSTLHPMTEEHFISFVYISTENGGQRKAFKKDAEPKTAFCFIDDKPRTVFAYCNLHGLWKVDI